MCVHATQNRQTSLLLIDAVVLFVFPCIFSLLNTQPKRLRQENGPEYSIERPQVQGTTKCAFLPSEWWDARSASMYFVRPAIRIAGTKMDVNFWLLGARFSPPYFRMGTWIFGSWVLAHPIFSTIFSGRTRIFGSWVLAHPILAIKSKKY